VPASKKLVSLFEPHADIILKSLPLRRRGVPATCSTDIAQLGHRPQRLDPRPGRRGR
jgi:hypothetical protein